ncbi:MAG: D-2-hydroxyacid dehydrogenase, partial [Halanaerobium sp.]
MKIVVLDGYAVNPGDLSWDKIKELGELEIYDRTPKEKILARSREADILLT